MDPSLAGFCIRALTRRQFFNLAADVVRKVKGAGGPCTLQAPTLLLLWTMNGERNTQEVLNLFAEWRDWLELSEAETLKILKTACARGFVSEVEKLLGEEAHSNPRYAKLFLPMETSRGADSAMLLSIAKDQLTHGTHSYKDMKSVMDAAVRERDAAMAVSTLEAASEWTPPLCMSVLSLFDSDRDTVWPVVPKMRERCNSVLLRKRIMDCYGKMEQFHDVVVLYEEIARSDASGILSTSDMNYHLKLMDQSEEGWAGPALKILEGMTGTHGPKPDAYSFSHVIRTCGKSRQLGDAFVAFEMAKEADLVNAVTYTNLIGACSRSRDRDAAFAMVEEMQSNGYKLQTATLVSLVNSCKPAETGALSPAALRCFEIARQNDIMLPTGLRIFAMRSYIEQKAYSEAAVVFASLDDETNRTFGMNAFASALIKDGEYEWALSVLEDEALRQTAFDSYSVHMYVKMCHQFQKWEEVVDIMKKARVQKVGRKAGVYLSAIEACAELGWADDALRLLDEMVADGYSVPEKGYYHLMVACMKKNMKPMVIRLHREMIKSGIDPSERIIELHRMVTKPGRK